MSLVDHKSRFNDETNQYVEKQVREDFIEDVSFKMSFKELAKSRKGISREGNQYAQRYWRLIHTSHF